MDVKLSLTTHCNAKCRTCPVWSIPGRDMPWEVFTNIWSKINASKLVSRILLNNTGDMYVHPDHIRMFEYIEQHHYKPIIMTTNAAGMDYVPAVDLIIISFNGGTKGSYEYTTGLSWDEVTATIRSHYSELARRPLEMHMLAWDGNAGTEQALVEYWHDFPGRIRVSYKYDNQMRDDHTLPQYRRTDRIPCDYLDMISVMPDGRVVSCAHDFHAVTNFGNLYTGTVAGTIKHPNRLQMKAEHARGEFRGLCAKCNYNTPIGDRVVYLK